MSIELARIDDRLIHGQVMTSWVNYTNANKIVVIDDTTANDAFLSMMIKSLVPANIEAIVTTLADSVKVVNDADAAGRVLILAKTPAPYLHLINNGVELKRVNLGGMGGKVGRSVLYRNISASEEEKDCMKEIIAKGVPVEIQLGAEDNAIDVQKYF